MHYIKGTLNYVKYCILLYLFIYLVTYLFDYLLLFISLLVILFNCSVLVFVRLHLY
jgi:hypothetical protein